MPAPDISVVERQYWLDKLGWTSDNPLLSIPELRERFFTSQLIHTLDVNITKESQSTPLASSIASVAGSGVVATDNGDGGVTLTSQPAPVKLSKWSYVEATFLKLVNTVQLAITTPLRGSTVGTAGTANTAARGDHQHPIVMPAYALINPQPSGYDSWTTPLGKIDSSSLNNGQKGPMTPLPVPRPFTLKNFMFRNQGGDGSSQFSIAIYACNSQGLPIGAPIYSTSYAGATGTGNVTVPINGSTGVDLTDPLYWIAYGGKGFTSTRPVPCGLGGGDNQMAASYFPTFGFGAFAPGLWLNTYNETTGAWPTIAGIPDFAVYNNCSGFTYAIQGVLL